MKKILAIRSVKSNIELPETTLENFVNNLPNKRNRGNNFTTCNCFFSNRFENIEVRSAHAPVNGTVEIVFSRYGKSQSMNIPVTTGFFFTCIKGKEGLFKMNWSCSMS